MEEFKLDEDNAQVREIMDSYMITTFGRPVMLSGRKPWIKAIVTGNINELKCLADILDHLNKPISSHTMLDKKPYQPDDTIRELRAQKDNLLTALKLTLPILEAHTAASHLTGGFRPRRNKNDDILDRVKVVIGKAGG